MDTTDTAGQSTGTIPGVNYTTPYVTEIETWLTNAGLATKVERDADIAHGDAHHFWTVACLDRPNTQLFVCVSHHADNDKPQVLVTADVRYIEDQEIIPELGAVTMLSMAPRLTARIVLDAVDSFRNHGHI